MTRPLTPIKLLGKDGAYKVSGQAAAQAAAYGQDLLESNAFAPLRQNNHVECFTTGVAYFAAVAAAMKAAKKSIFIAGWQVNWDVQLTDNERLIDVLHDRIKSSDSFRVFVLPWLSPKIGVNTNDLETMLAIFQLNAGRKSMQAMCCPAGELSDYIGTEGAAFSHHQKLVVIDNEIAYVGGMDLAYGRRDDENFSLDPGKKAFNERYNPGVPGSETVNPGHGVCLSMMDLLTTTLSAGKWNIGGNSAPGKISEFLHGAMTTAKEQSLLAVSLVNMGAAIEMNAASSVRDAGAAALNAGVSGAKHAANATADVAVAAANAVSTQCAMMQIPDMYGAVISHKVGAVPTSGIPGTLRDAETATRAAVNHAVDDLASLANFMAPLKQLRVRSTPHSAMPGALESAERGVRAGLNATINEAAALAGTSQAVAEQGRQVCVEIGPGVQRGVTATKATVKEFAHQSRLAANSAEAAIENTINAFQREIFNSITNIREKINDKYLALVAQGSGKLDNFIRHKSQADLNDILKLLMRMAKMIYASQIALSWQDAAAHPLLLEPGTKLAAANGKVLGSTQPQEPWQDVHCQLKGPVVDDLARNFIGRWNAAQKSYLSEQTMSDMGLNPLMKAMFENKNGPIPSSLLIPSHLIPASRTPQTNERPANVTVRVLRSAPLKLCMQEAAARGDKVKPLREQREIQTQMINLIKGATDFIYIENQFYQTGFGVPSIDIASEAGKALTSGPMQFMYQETMNRLKSELSTAGFAPGSVLLPANEIGDALGAKIAEAVRWDRPFHVYLVLPVHPEGPLNDITVVGQVHWTMQSLVFADHSLINLVRRAIAARQLCKNTLSNKAWEDALGVAGKRGDKKAPYELVSEGKWSKYLTLLNLRNCQKVGGVVCTEQIYIHSKLLIVDDRHVIIGSANINDRSQSGKRDSELAVMLLDTEEMQRPIRDNTTHVNKLARKLRTDIWRKHFALDLSKKNGVVQPASEMEAMIERPAAEATIKAIQDLARTNAKHYTETFPHVPWSNSAAGKGVETGSSIWPVCPLGTTAEGAAELSKKMPFHKNFWSQPNYKIEPPIGIKGFFTKLATNWTIGENNHPGEMSVMALTLQERRQEQAAGPGQFGDNMEIT